MHFLNKKHNYSKFFTDASLTNEYKKSYNHAWRLQKAIGLKEVWSSSRNGGCKYSRFFSHFLFRMVTNLGSLDSSHYSQSTRNW